MASSAMPVMVVPTGKDHFTRGSERRSSERDADESLFATGKLMRTSVRSFPQTATLQSGKVNELLEVTSATISGIMKRGKSLIVKGDIRINLVNHEKKYVIDVKPEDAKRAERDVRVINAAIRARGASREREPRCRVMLTGTETTDESGKKTLKIDYMGRDRPNIIVLTQPFRMLNNEIGIVEREHGTRMPGYSPLVTRSKIEGRVLPGHSRMVDGEEISGLLGKKYDSALFITIHGGSNLLLGLTEWDVPRARAVLKMANMQKSGVELEVSAEGFSRLQRKQIRGGALLYNGFESAHLEVKDEQRMWLNADRAQKAKALFMLENSEHRASIAKDDIQRSKITETSKARQTENHTTQLRLLKGQITRLREGIEKIDQTLKRIDERKEIAAVQRQAPDPIPLLRAEEVQEESEASDDMLDYP